MWMNSMDIEMAAEGCQNHPVLGPATRFLKALMESVNDQSDGWPYWSAPGKAASELMDLIQENTFWGAPTGNNSITLKDVEWTLAPIKKMAIYQEEKQKEYGNKFHFDVDLAWEEAKETI